MLLLGATPPNRHIEQHDIFFGIADSIKELVPAIQSFWPEAKDKIHIDAWREITILDNHKISIVSANDSQPHSGPRLFFINLGGYKAGEFEEFHYKMIIAANDKGEAITKAKNTAFFKHTGFKGATSHVDDKYGVDVDDLYEIRDIIPPSMKQAYKIVVSPADGSEPEDELHLGYFKLASFL
jgi:hypothetical protein